MKGLNIPGSQHNSHPMLKVSGRSVSPHLGFLETEYRVWGSRHKWWHLMQRQVYCWSESKEQGLTVEGSPGLLTGKPQLACPPACLPPRPPPRSRTQQLCPLPLPASVSNSHSQFLWQTALWSVVKHWFWNTSNMNPPPITSHRPSASYLIFLYS